MKARTPDASILVTEPEQTKQDAPETSDLSEELVDTSESDNVLQSLIPVLNGIFASASTDTILELHAI